MFFEQNQKSTSIAKFTKINPKRNYYANFSQYKKRENGRKHHYGMILRENVLENHGCRCSPPPSPALALLRFPGEWKEKPHIFFETPWLSKLGSQVDP